MSKAWEAPFHVEAALGLTLRGDGPGPTPEGVHAALAKALGELTFDFTDETGARVTARVWRADVDDVRVERSRRA